MDTFGLSVLDKNSSIHIERLDTADDQFEIFKKIYYLYNRVFILESLIGPKELSEVSIIGFDPKFTITCNSKKFRLSNGNKTIEELTATEPLSQLRQILPKINDNRFRYVGGAVGYVSYDAICFWEELRFRKKGKRDFPLLEFGIYLDGILYNHIERRAYYMYVGENSRLEEVEKKINEVTQKKTDIFSYSNIKRNMTKEYFIRMVNRSKKFIYEGDVYQVVLSKKTKFDIKGDLLGFYENLRKVNPSPYMYLMRMDDRSIIGSSPEMLIRVTNDYVETFPIAGTRPVLNDRKKNEELGRELLKDEKEVAEHTMLVDLARNDIGKVCKYGTVKVDKLMTVKKFSHVQHIVSHVSGRLQKKHDSYDAFKAVFPAGTVSGAPKVRAMQIIDELEPESREVYAGALGYFSFNGSCDFAITIRSIFVNKNKAYIQSGAGIVIDSLAKTEWAETEGKANALLYALKMTEAKQIRSNNH